MICVDAVAVNGVVVLVEMNGSDRTGFFQSLILLWGVEEGWSWAEVADRSDSATLTGSGSRPRTNTSKLFRL